MRYTIVEGKSMRDGVTFDYLVQEMIDRGWQPIGGVAFDSHNQRLFQAMTIEGDELPPKWMR